MVRIVNGRIVEDNDIEAQRLVSQHGSSSGSNNEEQPQSQEGFGGVVAALQRHIRRIPEYLKKCWDMNIGLCGFPVRLPIVIVLFIILGLIFGWKALLASLALSILLLLSCYTAQHQYMSQQQQEQQDSSSSSAPSFLFSSGRNSNNERNGTQNSSGRTLGGGGSGSGSGGVRTIRDLPQQPPSTGG